MGHPSSCRKADAQRRCNAKRVESADSDAAYSESRRCGAHRGRKVGSRTRGSCASRGRAARGCADRGCAVEARRREAERKEAASIEAAPRGGTHRGGTAGDAGTETERVEAHDRGSRSRPHESSAESRRTVERTAAAEVGICTAEAARAKPPSEAARDEAPRRAQHQCRSEERPQGGKRGRALEESWTSAASATRRQERENGRSASPHKPLVDTAPRPPRSKRETFSMQKTSPDAPLNSKREVGEAAKTSQRYSCPGESRDGSVSRCLYTRGGRLDRRYETSGQPAPYPSSAGPARSRRVEIRRMHSTAVGY